MTYNMSFVENVTGLYALVEGVNTASGGWLIGLFLITAWVLMILVFQNKSDTEGLLIGSSFVMAILSGLLFFAGLIPGWVLVLPVLGLIGGIAFKYMS